ncbi:hypothetical protein BDN70DRAFT_903055 [Pholiota conissans]|uniref:HNH nuclease domain-containing protein n=1 Tax=Pholiota conissans TaxID=109636 RepID=A0A9P5ZE57_9AGAR|nr:hypothetical protein BDN70DRAFT_903055 [Pholiota conissans]
MSRVEKDKESNQLRVAIPSGRRLPPNPHIGIGQTALSRALEAPSEATEDSELVPEPKEEKSLRHRLLACDQRSFITGSAAADLEAAYILAAVHKDQERKKVVELLLTRLRIYNTYRSSSFALDSPENAILLEANLRRQWSLYATYCIVPDVVDAQSMLDELRTSNRQWENSYRSTHTCNQMLTRPLDVSKPPFYKPSWDIVVLHPLALLPDGQPLCVATNRFFYSSSQTLSPTSQLTWTMWTATGDCLHSYPDQNQYFNPFIARLINANIKLQQFMAEHGGSTSSLRITQYAKLMSALVEEIFFVPPQYDIEAELFPNPSHDVQHTESLITPPSIPARHIAEQSSEATNLLDNPASGGMENQDASVLEYPKVPDTDGLTDTEFRLVSKQACNPDLSPSQRANAAMLMIFGTSRYKKPYVQGPPV